MSEENEQKQNIIIEHPMDAFIALALYTETRHVVNIRMAVSHAIKRRKWELEHMSSRWVHKRAEKLEELSCWMVLQDKLMDLSGELEGIPF